MAFNRWLDVKFDALNPRTAIREIPAGIISKNSALPLRDRFQLPGIHCLPPPGSSTRCVLPSPLWPWPSRAGLQLYQSGSPHYVTWVHWGSACPLAPIGAFLAVTGYFAWLPILFSLTVVFWVSGFDIILRYLPGYEEVSISAQHLYSMPSWLGKAKALRVSEFLHLLSTLPASS